MSENPNQPTDKSPRVTGARAFTDQNDQDNLSKIFINLAQQAKGPVSMMQIRDALGDRSFAALLVFFAAINLIPVPPGATLILGLPLLIIAIQMVWGAQSVWLPRYLLNKSVSEEKFRSAADRLVPKLVSLEKYIKPRFWPLPGRYDERIIGFLSLLMAILVTLPVPFGNWFPALTITLAGLALSQRDGILLLASAVVAFISVVVLALLLTTMSSAFNLVTDVIN